METKPCKNCGAEIFREATRCPYCGKTLRIGAGPVFLLVGLASAGVIAAHDMLLDPGNAWVLRRGGHSAGQGPTGDEAAGGATVTGAWHSPEPESAQPSESPAASPVTKSAELPATKMSQAAAPLAGKPAALPKGFVPPKPGTQVRVVLVNGTVWAGTLRAVSGEGVEIEKGESTTTLPRSQMAGESRIRFFAADYELFQSRKASRAAEEARTAAAWRTKGTTGVPAGETPVAAPSPAPAQGEKDAATIFFEAFSK